MELVALSSMICDGFKAREGSLVGAIGSLSLTKFDSASKGLFPSSRLNV